MSQKIMIFASELAACLGQNRYTTINETVSKIWKRVDLDSYKTASKRNTVIEKKTINETLNENVLLKESISKEFFEKKKLHVGNSIEMEKKITQIFETINEPVNVDLIKDIKSFIQTTRGTRDEDSSLNDLEKKKGVEIEKRNNKLYIKTIVTDFGESFLLAGRVDGITKNGELVEMKNRQYKFFKEIPIYEKIQIHAYMFLTDKQSIQFVQNFNDESVSEVVTFDLDFWNGDIIIPLKKFVKLFRMLLRDPLLQDKVIQNQTFDFFEIESEPEEVDEKINCLGCEMGFFSQRDHECLNYGK
jgi:hypothetical protein